jgi:[amino group carrier protein]-L-2-aminoadipate 6-kinase
VRKTVVKDIVVVKCGGNAAVDPESVCVDVAQLHRAGHPIILVHGGSADIDRLADRLGVITRRLVAPDGVSARYTDQATLEVVTLALAGAVQPRLTAALARAGARAVGLTGLDGPVLRARRKKAHRALVDGRTVMVRDSHSGRVTDVDTSLLLTLLTEGVIPVLAPPALAEDGRPVNVDADRTAAAVAAAMSACALVLLTGAPGVLRDPADETSILPECALGDGPPPFVGGGMGLKLVAAREALAGGVRQVVVADGRGPSSVRRALAGAGTRVVLAEAIAGVRT